GGTAPGTGNAIAFNGGDGVHIGSDAERGFLFNAGTTNSVLGNRIVANDEMGIDLGANDNVTANDINDPDSGPNDLQNFPDLTTADLTGTSLRIAGSINTNSGKKVRIEFFASPTADPTAHGEGARFIGFIEVDMGTDNAVSFNKEFATSLAHEGDVVSATATDELGNTSEFSP